jgi:hypothetical protein
MVCGAGKEKKTKAKTKKAKARTKSRTWKVENRKWKVESGKWKLASEKAPDLSLVPESMRTRSLNVDRAPPVRR